ncbi:MAG: hypothetical protein WC503_06660 [Candidatus Shapirobacteria bacterium]
MKNKLFWPIIVISIIIIVESIVLISRNQANKTALTNNVEVNVTPNEEVKKVADVFSFEWLYESGKATLTLTANQTVSIDAIDLYIGYKNVKVDSVKNLEELPKPSFTKISTEKSLVVMNYLISEADGFKITAGQNVKIAELEISPDADGGAELTIDKGTLVVENGTAKVLPFSSRNLIINGAL